MGPFQMSTTFRYLFASLRNSTLDNEETEYFDPWTLTMKQEISGGAVPGIDPRPGTEPDPEPEPDPDPEPLPLPTPNPGPDPGFPIAPYPRPVPIRVAMILQNKFYEGDAGANPE